MRFALNLALDISPVGWALSALRSSPQDEPLNGALEIRPYDEPLSLDLEMSPKDQRKVSALEVSVQGKP